MRVGSKSARPLECLVDVAVALDRGDAAERPHDLKPAKILECATDCRGGIGGRQVVRLENLVRGEQHAEAVRAAQHTVRADTEGG